ncbi:MAG: DUF305 domain-containing protein [Rubrobacteraceae bacterium]|nr:DUF305 domain-containing protein [Rubrobacter sp.]
MRSTTPRGTWKPGAKVPSSRQDALLLPLALLAALAVTALFIVYLSTRSPDDNSVEAGFARDMSTHHAQAVEMAEIVQNKTGSDEIRTLASDIALTQQAQIGQMRGWLDVWGLSPTGSEPAMAWMGHPTEGRMPGMASPEQINQLREASPEEADKLFLRLMIPHHGAAVPMAQAAIEDTDRPEVENLARTMIASQKAEIKIMEDMLRERGAKPPASEASPMHDGMDMGGA